LWWFVVDFWLLRGWLRFAGLFLLGWGAESVIFLMVKTWIKRGELCGFCGHFDGGFET
jgi:hypothetical protein